MKLLAGLVIALLAVFYQQCDAIKDACCQKFQYGGPYYQKGKLFAQKKFIGKPRIAKGGLINPGFPLTDGYNYDKYFAISAFATDHFIMSDVCFYVQCADSVKVVAYGANWKYLTTFLVPLHFSAHEKYYQSQYVCLSDKAIYNALYDFPFCLDHVKYVRIFASQKDFGDIGANAYYPDGFGYNYYPGNNYGDGYVYHEGVKGSAAGGKVGGSAYVDGAAYGGAAYGGGAGVKGPGKKQTGVGAGWVPVGSAGGKGVVKGGVVGVGHYQYDPHYDPHYDQHYPTGGFCHAVVTKGHMIGCGTHQKKIVHGGQAGHLGQGSGVHLGQGSGIHFGQGSGRNFGGQGSGVHLGQGSGVHLGGQGSGVHFGGQGSGRNFGQGGRFIGSRRRFNNGKGVKGSRQFGARKW